MDLKDFWDRSVQWVRSLKPIRTSESGPELNNEDLITESAEQKQEVIDAAEPEESSKQVAVKTVGPKDKEQSLEKLQAGFNKLIEQLQGINENLNSQATHQEELMGHMEHLPKLLESFPAVVQSQKQLTEQLIEQLQASNTKNQQFIEAVERIPNETAKQTDALVNIDHELAASADTDVQMTENFNKFNAILDKLNQSTNSQTDGIMQMSKTFATSDRYLKYIVSRQNRRFMWIFMTALGVCVTVILILVGIIIFLKE